LQALLANGKLHDQLGIKSTYNYAEALKSKRQEGHRGQETLQGREKGEFNTDSYLHLIHYIKICNLNQN